MSAVAAWVRHDLSRRWGRVAALAVFVALAGGIAIATVAGVRRSDSVVERTLDAVRPATGIVVANEPGFDWAPVAALPEVEQLIEFPVLYFELVGFDGEEFGGFPPATADGLDTMERPVVVRGRAADQHRADEVTISPDMHARGIAVGDRLTIKLGSMADALAGELDFRDRRRVEVTVVGVAKLSFFAWEVQPTYAFYREHRDLIADGAFLNALVTLRGGADDLPAFQRGLAEVAGRPVEVLDQLEFVRETTRSVDLETSALALLAAAALVVVFVLVGQALSRLVAANPDELALLRQLGASTRTTALAAVAAPATGVLAGVLAAPLVAFALSDRFPIGVGRDLEPQPGRQFDVVAAAAGVAILLVVLGAVLALTGLRSMPDRPAAGRARRPGAPSPVSRLPLPIPAAIGARLALGRQALRTEARAVTWAAVIAVAGVVAAVTFAAGLEDAMNDRRAFGQPFDIAAMVTDGAPVDLDAYAALGAAGAARLRNVVATIDGRAISTVSVETLAGDVTLRPQRGRVPGEPDEIALSPEARSALGARIGDRVRIEGQDAVVVGEMFLPEAGHTSYTSGAVVPPAMTDRLESAGLPVKFEYLAFDLPVGTDVDAALGRLDEPARSQVSPFPPTARQEALRHTRSLPGWFGLTVVVLALGAAAHGLSATVRRRHREVAVLQVLGLTRGQARATVFWHALVAAGTGVVVGVPVGFAIGRTVWETVAASLPAFYRSPPAWAGVALVVPAVIAVAIALAGWPARRSAASEPALVLRTE